MVVKTNKGQKVEIGGLGGLPFNNIVPEGARVVALGGGLNDQINDLYAYFVHLP